MHRGRIVERGPGDDVLLRPAGPVHPAAGRRRARPRNPFPPGRSVLIRQYLHDGWQLTATTNEVPDNVRGRTVPATVPGSTHLDLLASGLITDPFLDRAEDRADLDAPRGLALPHHLPRRRRRRPGEQADLVFDGPGHRRRRRAQRARARPHREHAPQLPLRRPAAPRRRRQRPHGVVLLRADPRREGRGRARPARARQRAPVQHDPQDGLQLRLGLGTGPADRGDLAAGPAGALAHRAARPGPADRDRDRGRDRPRRAARRRRVGARHRRDPDAADHRRRAQRTVAVPAGQTDPWSPAIDVPDAELWWPAGYGEQPLYDLDVVLRGGYRAARPAPRGGSGSARSPWTRRPTSIGTPFTAGGQRTSRSSSRAPTGFPTTTSSPGSPASGWRGGWTRPWPRTSTCCGCGAAGSTSPTTSTTSATSAESWSGRTSRSRAPPTRRRNRCAASSRPRPARTSRA